MDADGEARVDTTAVGEPLPEPAICHNIGAGAGGWGTGSVGGAEAAADAGWLRRGQIVRGIAVMQPACCEDAALFAGTLREPELLVSC